MDGIAEVEGVAQPAAAELQPVTSGNRPDTLVISPASSIISAVRQDTEQEDTDFPYIPCEADDDEIAKLLRDYAERDNSYEGSKVINSLSSKSASEDDGDSEDDIARDGPVQSKRKKMEVLALHVDANHLSVVKSGKMRIYHHSDPNFMASVLQLNPDQSPKLVPVYNPQRLDSGTVIKYIQQPGGTTPGSNYVRVESNTKVYLALDYTDSQNPKLITLKDTELEGLLIEMRHGSGMKIKPIINSRAYPDKAGLNNTTLYFKTENNYYFLSVNEGALSLEVKAIPIEKGKKADYQSYLYFGPKPVSSTSLEETDGLLFEAPEEKGDGASDTTSSSDVRSDAMKEDDGLSRSAVTKSTVPVSSSEESADEIVGDAEDSATNIFSAVLSKKISSGSIGDSGVDTRSPELHEEKTLC